MASLLIRCVFVLGATCSLGGCALWVTPEAAPFKLPQARTSPDSVGLDIVCVGFPAADLETDQAIWAEADEQHFPAEVRRKLAANGLRCGILGVSLPTRLRELLSADTNPWEDRSENLTTLDGEASRQARHQQCRAGRPVKVMVSKTYESLAALIHDEGGLHGHQLKQAQCLFRLKPYPQGDGRVRLDLTPEIEHGESKPRWVEVGAGSLMQRTSRDRLVLDQLQLVATLSPGQVLILSAASDPKGVGEQFFSETAGGTVERTLLLVRLSQTQYDDLFAPDQIAAPLATPGE